METNEYLSLSYAEKLNLIIDNPTELHLPELASFVAQYMEQYRPCNPPDRHEDNQTSLDIQETLQSICDVDINLISRVMKMLGYKLYFAGISQPEWSMKHADSV